MKQVYDKISHDIPLFQGKGSSILMMRIFFVVMVIFLDKIIYEILMIINQYSRVDYEQTGVCNINTKFILLVYLKVLGEVSSLKCEALFLDQ